MTFSPLSFALAQALCSACCLGWLPINAYAVEPKLATVLPAGFAESQLHHVNQLNEAVGRCEVFDAAGNAIVDFVFRYREGVLTPLPCLEHYRRMECVGISDSGWAIGHAYAPIDQQQPALQAYIFDPETATTRALPGLHPAKSSIATAISADGQTIVGSCVNTACIWLREGSGWSVSQLPEQLLSGNTQRVCLSNSGRIAAAFMRGDTQAALVQWTRDETGGWSQTICLEQQVTPYDINDMGVIVGSLPIVLDGRSQTRGFAFTPPGTLELIQPLEKHNFSTARSVNRHGSVVGWSDRVGDESAAPASLCWKQGKSSALDLGARSADHSHQAYSINDQGSIAGLLARDNDLRVVGFLWTESP